MPQFVKLVNENPTPFDFHHKNKKKIIPPYGDAVVPWDLACTLFGDPYLLDDGKNNDRTRVAKQVKGNFGFMSGMMTAEEWEVTRPHVAVYDLENGERIYMLLEDPEGLHSLPDQAEVDNSDQLAFLTRQVAQLTAAIAAISARATSPDVAESGAAEGQILTTSTDAPNVEPDPSELSTYTLVIPGEDTPIIEDAPHTPTLPPRPKK